jgi:hypothetical protein
MKARGLGGPGGAVISMSSLICLLLPAAVSEAGIFVRRKMLRGTGRGLSAAFQIPVPHVSGDACDRSWNGSLNGSWGGSDARSTRPPERERAERASVSRKCDRPSAPVGAGVVPYCSLKTAAKCETLRNPTA